MASEKKKLPSEESPSTADILVKKLDPLTKLLGYGTIVVGFGFSAGIYIRGNQAELDKMRMDQECNNRVQKLENSLNEAQRNKTQADLESLNQVVKQLQQQQHGK